MKRNAFEGTSLMRAVALMLASRLFKSKITISKSELNYLTLFNCLKAVAVVCWQICPSKNILAKRLNMRVTESKNMLQRIWHGRVQA